MNHLLWVQGTVPARKCWKQQAIVALGCALSVSCLTPSQPLALGRQPQCQGNRETLMAAVTRNGRSGGGVLKTLVCGRVTRCCGCRWEVFHTVNKRSRNKHKEQALKSSQEAVAWHAELEWNILERWKLSRKDPRTVEKRLYFRRDRGGELIMGKNLRR